MIIKEVVEDKSKYKDLLFLADEDETMIKKYIDLVDMFIIEVDNEAIASICVLEVDKNTLEIKNIATKEAYQREGYGRALINYIEERYKGAYQYLIVGTGDSNLTIPFYKRCGFKKYSKIKNFFTDNYKNPIIEDGVVLKDMIYLRKNL